jgi:hypothetical protein
MVPFDLYLDGGREPLGTIRGSNARHEYGLKFMRVTGQRCCAYCGTELTSNYQIWLTLVLDHVTPLKLCKQLRVPSEWVWDFSNTVLACAACNGFCNRYSPAFTITSPGTRGAFCELRDKIFDDRKRLIAARHEEERQFFNGRPWEVSDVPLSEKLAPGG